MITKYISSTQAQNNFGQVLDDVMHKRTRYIVRRRGTAQAVVIGFDDFVYLLDHEAERQQLSHVLNEVRPEYTLGEPLELLKQPDDDPKAR